ncbi:anti-sigma-I factor RsgI family protein, partial [Neobacillus drentensis]|uniref:anti-sigma-I factor RsgI family protein n=1 Tax=Neobacillus drentensis TaxID=220684 RepID=UPI003000F725
MKKGIVMEIDDACLTLLTPEGEFLHARRQNQPYLIGEEIHFFPMESVKTNKYNTVINILKLKPVWALMAALLIFLGSFFPMYQNNKAYAYMSIDVNPSIELGINKKMQVVEITGYNKEGKQIISQLNKWRNKDVSKVAQSILAEMKEEGFFKTQEHVIISTVRTKESEDRIEKKLLENIEEIKASVNKEKLELTVLKASESEMNKAHKLGITTGKYQENKIQGNLIKKAKTKAVEEKTEQSAVLKNPAGKIPPAQFKKQSDHKAIQNKGISENKRITEKIRLNGKLKSQGQPKKVEAAELKKKLPQHQKQNNQREKPSENKKTTRNENHKEKVNLKGNSKKVGGPKTKDKQRNKQKDKQNDKQKDK